MRVRDVGGVLGPGVGDVFVPGVGGVLGPWNSYAGTHVASLHSEEYNEQPGQVRSEPESVQYELTKIGDGPMSNQVWPPTAGQSSALKVMQVLCGTYCRWHTAPACRVSLQ